MPVTIYEPKSRAEWLALRRPNVGASEVGALLGVHDYATPFDLWAAKAGKIPGGTEETAPMRRGRLLESVAVAMLQEDRPDWRVHANILPSLSYFVDRDIRLAATPDAFALDPGRSGRGIVQMKSVEPSVFRRKWHDDDGNIVPPLWIAAQACVEAHLTGATWAAVGALVVGFGVELHIVEVPIHAGLIERVKAEVVKFWASVESNTPPPIDLERDGETIKAMFAHDDGTEIDLSADNELPGLMIERETAKDIIKRAGAVVDRVNTHIKSKMGAATYGWLPGWRITWKEHATRPKWSPGGTCRTLTVSPAKGSR